MTEQALKTIDLTRPHDRIYLGGAWIKFKKTETSEGVFYVPSFIAPEDPRRRGWRVRIKRTTPPFAEYVGGTKIPLHQSLKQAWALVIDLLTEEGLRDMQIRKPKVSIETGRTGVRLGRTKPGDDRTFALRVSQSIETERAHNEIFYSVARDELSREAFNRMYRKAIAARNYYEELRKHQYRLSQAITKEMEIPEAFYPDDLPKPDLFDQLLQEVRK